MMLQHLFILWDKFNCPQRGIQILQQKKQCFDNLRTKRLSWSGLLLGKLGPYSRFSFLQKNTRNRSQKKIVRKKRLGIVCLQGGLPGVMKTSGIWNFPSSPFLPR